MLYGRLHRLARREIARHGGALTLGATTLLHEVYLDMASARTRVSRRGAVSRLCGTGDARPGHRPRARRQAHEARRRRSTSPRLDTDAAEPVPGPDDLLPLGEALRGAGSWSSRRWRRWSTSSSSAASLRRDRGACAASPSAPCSGTGRRRASAAPRAAIAAAERDDAGTPRGHCRCPQRHWRALDRRRCLDEALDLAPTSARAGWRALRRGDAATRRRAVRRCSASTSRTGREGFLEGTAPRRSRRDARGPTRWARTRCSAARPGRHGQRVARAAQRRPYDGAVGGQAAQHGADRRTPASERFKREGSILARLHASAHRPPARRRRQRRRPALPGARATSKASPSTATATRRRLDVEARVGAVSRRARRGRACPHATWSCTAT